MGDFVPFALGSSFRGTADSPTAIGAANGPWRIGIFLPEILIFILFGSSKHIRAVFISPLLGGWRAKGDRGGEEKRKRACFGFSRKKSRICRKLYAFPLQNHLKTYEVSFLALPRSDRLLNLVLSIKSTKGNLLPAPVLAALHSRVREHAAIPSWSRCADLHAKRVAARCHATSSHQ